MSQVFSIRVEFLLGAYHGRSVGGEPNWPPSPLRLFQALISAAAGHDNERREIISAARALRWLESQSAPRILAPNVRLAQPYRLYVPNNTGDLVAAAWSRHSKSSIAKFRTEKDVRPKKLIDEDAIYYLWNIPRLDDPSKACIKELIPIVRSMSHLGWGIDMVVANAELLPSQDAANLPGLVHDPVDGHGGIQLSIPVPGTFDAVARRYAQFLGRLAMQDGERVFIPVSPLTTFRPAHYQAENQAPRRHFAAFALTPVADLHESTSARFQAYDPITQGSAVAGMIRHILADPKFHAQLGWEAERLPFLHGHGEADGKHTPSSGSRLAILPLPTLEFRGAGRVSVVGNIRRVLLTVMRGDDASGLSEVESMLAGRLLEPADERTKQAVLTPLPEDRMISKYTRAASTWTTVTPVVLPGFDDRRRLRRRLGRTGSTTISADEKKAIVKKLDIRIESLLRKAIVQADFSPAMAQCASLEWRGSGFLPGAALARNYFAPIHLQHYRRLHVRITWRDKLGEPMKIPGPICLGGGRFFGLGLFVPCDST